MSYFLTSGTTFLIHTINILHFVSTQFLRLPNSQSIATYYGPTGLDMSGRSFILLELISFFIGFKKEMVELEGNEMP